MCLPVTPYKVEREWEHAGLMCAVVQGGEATNRCGYVRVPPTHPAFGKDYDSLDVDVHGGLTFAEKEPCNEHPDGQGWWVGFDCAHYGDRRYDPNMKPEDCATEEGRSVLEFDRDFSAKHPTYHSLDEHFWTLPEVAQETERLAEQLAGMEKRNG